MGAWFSRPRDRLRGKDTICTEMTGCNDTHHPRWLGIAQDTWRLLHNMTLALPDRLDKRRRADFWAWLINLGWVIPCPACGDHWVYSLNRLRKHRDVLIATRQSAVCFLFDLHNLWRSVRGDLPMTWAVFRTEYKVDLKHVNVLDKAFVGGLADQLPVLTFDVANV